MPNWCANIATFKHKDPEEIKRLQAAIEGEKMFSEFIPNPNGPQSEDWYEHNTTFWGTKWDTGGDIIKATKTKIEVSFDTAWSPPLMFYDAMTERGWNIHAEYFEPGMAFIGEYSSEHGNASYDIPENIDELDQLPTHLVENWNLNDNYPDDEEDDSEG